MLAESKVVVVVVVVVDDDDISSEAELVACQAWQVSMSWLLSSFAVAAGACDNFGLTCLALVLDAVVDDEVIVKLVSSSHWPRVVVSVSAFGVETGRVGGRPLAAAAMLAVEFDCDDALVTLSIVFFCTCLLPRLLRSVYLKPWKKVDFFADCGAEELPATGELESAPISAVASCSALEFCIADEEEVAAIAAAAATCCRCRCSTLLLFEFVALVSWNACCSIANGLPQLPPPPPLLLALARLELIKLLLLLLLLVKLSIELSRDFDSFERTKRMYLPLPVPLLEELPATRTLPDVSSWYTEQESKRASNIRTGARRVVSCCVCVGVTTKWPTESLHFLGLFVCVSFCSLHLEKDKERDLSLFVMMIGTNLLPFGS